MANRVLLIALTSLATCGLSTEAIAREWQPDEVASALRHEILISQSDNGDNSDSSQTSPAIQSLQTRLQELGYYDGKTDGIFGVETRDALADFQRDNGLVGTGILDPLTQERLADPDGASAEAEPPADAEPEGNTSETASAPEDAESPLSDLPPVNEDGQVQPGTEAEEAAPAEVAPSAQDTSEGAAAEAEAAPAAGNGLRRLVFLGLAIVLLGALGAGTILWFAKRRPSKTDAPVGSEAPSTPNNPAPTAQTRRTAPPPPPARPVSPPNQNGRQQPVSAKQQSALDVRHQSSSLSNPVEPKVAKINIIDELIHDLEQPNADQRRKAIWELGQRGNSAAVQPLVTLLEQADSQEQSLILAALAEIGIQTLKPINRGLVIALQSENAEVRKNAIRDLTRIYGSLNQAGRSLGHTSAIDDDPEVRQTANWALDQLNKMKLNANDSAGRLKESSSPQNKKLPEEQ